MWDLAKPPSQNDEKRKKGRECGFFFESLSGTLLCKWVGGCRFAGFVGKKRAGRMQVYIRHLRLFFISLRYDIFPSSDIKIFLCVTVTVNYYVDVDCGDLAS